MVNCLKYFKVEGDFKEQIDKVINLHFFRKLSGKTQVILSLTGPSVRTRLTHTVEVARIARKLCDDLGLNSDLAEAIALAHDLGHTPFGHVGERTLKEIMCGCDTLKGKINETDFVNSGFKHNLQSFRVLHTLEAISEDDGKWPYILWGVSAHSKMSWSKPYSGMENEILISCKHCDWVYSCLYHDKRECKRNIQEKKKETLKASYLCRPAFCATLDIYRSRDEVHPDLLKWRAKKEDFLGWFKDVNQIWCSKPCYLSALSAHKIENKEVAITFPYLFDHPFPNSFYGSHFFDYFGRIDKGFISVEAQVVSQADEIAQRQQDLEDAVSTELISFEMARDDVKELVKKILTNKAQEDIIQLVNNAKNQKELGEIIVGFYSKQLHQTTLTNFEEFSKKVKTNLNIFCLMNLLSLLDGNNKNRTRCFIAQLEKCQEGTPLAAIDALSEAFNMNYDSSYLYLLLYDFLDVDYRFGNYENCRVILPKLIRELSKELSEELSTELSKMPIYDEKNMAEDNLIKGLDRLHVILKSKFETVYNHFKKPDSYDDDNYWQNLNRLTLYNFYMLYLIYQELQKNKRAIERGFFLIDDLLDIDISKFITSYDKKEAFTVWKKVLRMNANMVLANLVKFTKDKGQQEGFDTFEEKQKNYILKSELVEKNDGKATYILKRLFSAFATNSHQLPDNGLDFILLALTNSGREIFLVKEQEMFIILLEKLKKTTIRGFDKIKQEMDTDLSQLKEDNFVNIRSSNEIKALIEKRKHLFDFIQYFENEVKIHLRAWIKSEVFNDKKDLTKGRLRFRGILDNPILNAMPYWKSLLTRGICDYIASLTDLEAIDQYEKLYASAMELV